MLSSITIRKRVLGIILWEVWLGAGLLISLASEDPIVLGEADMIINRCGGRT
jgi:hypothetical protein